MTNKELNTSKLISIIEQRKVSKLKLASDCGISRVTLDTLLKGGEIGLHKFLKVVNYLGLSISYLFDETVPPGNTSVEANGVLSVASMHSNVSVAADAVLAERVKSLEALLAEKERLISVLMSCKQTSAPSSHTQNM